MVSYSITLLLAPSSVLDCFALTYSLHHLLLVALFVVPVAAVVGAPLGLLVGDATLVGLLLVVAVDLQQLAPVCLLVALFVVPVAVDVGAPLPILVGVLLFSVGLHLLEAVH